MVASYFQRVEGNIAFFVAFASVILLFQFVLWVQHRSSLARRSRIDVLAGVLGLGGSFSVYATIMVAPSSIACWIVAFGLLVFLGLVVTGLQNAGCHGEAASGFGGLG